MIHHCNDWIPITWIHHKEKHVIWRYDSAEGRKRIHRSSAVTGISSSATISLLLWKDTKTVTRSLMNERWIIIFLQTDLFWSSSVPYQCFLFPFVIKTIQDGPLLFTVRTRTHEHLHVCSVTLIANTAGCNDISPNMLCSHEGTKQNTHRCTLTSQGETWDPRAGTSRLNTKPSSVLRSFSACQQTGGSVLLWGKERGEERGGWTGVCPSRGGWLSRRGEMKREERGSEWVS